MLQSYTNKQIYNLIVNERFREMKVDPTQVPLEVYPDNRSLNILTVKTLSLPSLSRSQ